MHAIERHVTRRQDIQPDTGTPRVDFASIHKRLLLILLLLVILEVFRRVIVYLLPFLHMHLYFVDEVSAPEIDELNVPELVVLVAETADV